jgi:predicted glycoside hydrolase/deacetylase ChbG (UPF0249 family)
MASNVVITCDDFGLSEGINKAAIELSKEGLLDYVSIIVNTPNFSDSVQTAIKHHIKTGIHLNLSDGYPVSENISALTKNGKFFHKYHLFLKSLRPSKRFINDFEKELEAQTELFVQEGLKLQHLSTHCQFHTFSVFNNFIKNLAKRHKVDWIRSRKLGNVVLPYAPISNNRAKDAQDGTKYFDYLVPLKYWLKFNPKKLADKIRPLEGAIEIVVHASTKVDNTFPANFPYSPKDRYREVVYLKKLMRLFRS